MIIYDFLVKAYLAEISDLFIISSTIIAIIRYDIGIENYKRDEGIKNL